MGPIAMLCSLVYTAHTHNTQHTDTTRSQISLSDLDLGFQIPFPFPFPDLVCIPSWEAGQQLSLLQRGLHNFFWIMFVSSAIIRAASRKSFGTSRNVVTVTSVMGREIIDSRGNPTVEVDVHTTAGRFRGDHSFCTYRNSVVMILNFRKTFMMNFI